MSQRELPQDAAPPSGTQKEALPDRVPHASGNDGMPLLMAKFHPPRLPASLIERPHLLERLDAGLEHKLMLLSAPAGFGKTTLVSQWIRTRFPRDDGAVAWVALDDGDNDPVRFWRYVITACQRFQSDQGRAALALLTAEPQSPLRLLSLEAVLATFLNTLTESQYPGRGILILEDYHVISEASIHETMAFFLNHLPASLHVMLLTRNDPALPLARLRANGELYELHITDLRFSLREMQSFLQHALVAQSSLFSENILLQIDERLEGWAAGLRLFALAVQGRKTQQEIERILATFAGSHRSLQEYFITEVLDAQPEALRRFLLQTCILSRLTGSLCDAITESDESEQLLEAAERAGLFLEALDSSGQWYRYHALFAEAMQHEARRRLSAEALHALSRKASMWYEEHAMLAEAVEAAFQAPDMVRVAELIERIIASQHLLAREAHTLYRWLHQMPNDMLRSHPTLCVGYARAILFVRIMDQPAPPPSVVARFIEVLQMAEDGFRTRGDMRGLADVLGFRALIARQRGEIREAAAYARQALSWVSEEDLEWRVLCMGILGTEEMLAGQFNTARKTLLAARVVCEAFGNRALTRTNTSMLSRICFEQGELQEAAAHYRQMLAEAREDDDNDDICDALIGLAKLSYEWNELHAAETQAQEALDLSMQLGDEEFQVWASLLLARIEHLRGQTESAHQRCAALLARMPATSSLRYRLSREIHMVQAKLYLTEDDLPAAQRYIRNNASSQSGSEHSTFDGTLPVVYREREETLVARWLIAQERSEEALAMLVQLLVAAQEADRRSSLLEIQMLMALSHASLRQTQEARRLLHSVLTQAHTQGYTRLFLDEGPAMTALLQAVLPTMHGKALIAYVHGLLHAFAQERAEPGSASVDTTLVEPLSSQELHVLRLLVAGRSNPEIAAELVVSVNTVKSQVQSIYRKMNVHNRVEASEVARLLKLL
jgi:LuxR family maltose regulon positive regulatory protein